MDSPHSHLPGGGGLRPVRGQVPLHLHRPHRPAQLHPGLYGGGTLRRDVCRCVPVCSPGAAQIPHHRPGHAHRGAGASVSRRSAEVPGAPSIQGGRPDPGRYHLYWEGTWLEHPPQQQPQFPGVRLYQRPTTGAGVPGLSLRSGRNRRRLPHHPHLSDAEFRPGHTHPLLLL